MKTCEEETPKMSSNLTWKCKIEKGENFQINKPKYLQMSLYYQSNFQIQILYRKMEKSKFSIEATYLEMSLYSWKDWVPIPVSFAL